MRGLALTIAAAAMLVSGAPAQAAWGYFACPSDNFASQFPAAPKMEKTIFSMPRHGRALAARTYTTTVDNIVYKMLVADYSDRADGASNILEAIFQHTGSRRSWPPERQVPATPPRASSLWAWCDLWRSITMDFPNGAGVIDQFLFPGWQLYEQSVTVLPANGDYSSPNGSLCQSFLFNLTRR